METLTIDIPASLKDYIQERVSEGGYSGPSDYLRQLIAADRKRQAVERLDDLLIEGLNSGEPIEGTPEFWEEMDQELAERHNPRRVQS